MRTISDSLKNHLALPTTTIAFCWKVTLKNGTIYGFTDHDKTISHDGVTYVATVGFSASAIDISSGLSASNLEVVGFLDSSRLNETRISAGDWDGASFELFILNYKDISMGKMTLLCGYVGNIRIEGPSKYVLELRGISSKLDVDVTQKCSPYCRYTLGDSYCKKTISSSPMTQTCYVVDISSKLIFYYDTSSGQSNDYYKYGKVTWLTGLNKGVTMEIASDWYDSTLSHYGIRLFEEMGRYITIGDMFQLVVGCDKLFATCKDKFSNHINFGGEPHVPGPDKAFGYQ